MNETVVTWEEITNLMMNLDARKPHGSDGVAKWILKEYTEELVDKV